MSAALRLANWRHRSPGSRRFSSVRSRFARCASSDQV